MNKPVILINGYDHGGTNILVNLILSHPDVCYPGETHKALAGGTKSHSKKQKKKKYRKFKKIFNKTDISDLGYTYNVNVKTEYPTSVVSWVRKTLNKEKIKAQHESHNFWETKDVKYKKRKIRSSRLLLKNNNTLSMQTKLFDDAFFETLTICLFRHPFSIIESQFRKNRDLDLMLPLLKKLMKYQIGILRDRKNDHFFIRFEDIITNPMNSLHRIYDFLGLNYEEVKYIRLQHKAYYSEKGSYVQKGKYNRQVVWYDTALFHKHLHSSSIFQSISRIDEYTKKLVSESLSQEMHALGYHVNEPYFTASFDFQ